MRQKSASGPRLVARLSDDGLIVAQRGVAVVCDKKHHNVPFGVANLPTSQKGRLRHICAGCAYERGFQDGLAAAKRGEEDPPED
jgi:hypothetical protein